MSSWSDTPWEPDHGTQQDRESAWDRAEDMERAADRLNERLNRDVGESGRPAKAERKKAA